MGTKLSNSLDKLYNLDTSKMTPEGKLMFEYLNLKLVTVPAVATESEINLLDNSNEIIKKETLESLQMEKK
ncbi:MAG: hypothetical protein PHY66_01820 [Aliarcobacter sp.]|nr:hypothetical protein [Aliarcobacter sp.]